MPLFKFSVQCGWFGEIFVASRRNFEKFHPGTRQRCRMDIHDIFEVSSWKGLIWRDFRLSCSCRRNFQNPCLKGHIRWKMDLNANLHVVDLCRFLGFSILSVGVVKNTILADVHAGTPYRISSAHINVVNKGNFFFNFPWEFLKIPSYISRRLRWSASSRRFLGFSILSVGVVKNTILAAVYAGTPYQISM